MKAKEKDVWRKKLISWEEQLIAFHKRRPQVKPDGSFAFSAFMWGYEVGRRHARKEVPL
jgi:hypothetical protein